MDNFSVNKLKENLEWSRKKKEKKKRRDKTLIFVWVLVQYLNWVKFKILQSIWANFAMVVFDQFSENKSTHRKSDMWNRREVEEHSVA